MARGYRHISRNLQAGGRYPNVLINAVSIGGGDDVAGLDSRMELIDKIKELGGKKMLDVRLRPIEEESHGLR